MKVLYLYTEIMGYNLPIFEQLATRHHATVDVIHWNQNKLTPFVPKIASANIRFHDRFSLTDRAMMDFAVNAKPDLVYVSGWQDKGYLPILQELKARGSKIVMGLDSQWTGSLRQRLGALLIRWRYKPRYFSYAWVPGPMQYAYASRIGFHKNEIICNLLSANTSVFSQRTSGLESDREKHYPKRFLYVGRFTFSKGIDTLIQAYKLYRNQLGGDWSLTCIGNGPLEPLLRAQPEIETLPFMAQTELAKQAEQSGAFLLPSRYEPWGVVVHEFSTAGLPLILSDQVGASAQFLVDELNGSSFCHESAEDLAVKMYAMSSKSASQLIEMGRVSRQLSSSIDPAIAAASFVSALRASV
jgi:glycosyltransferase involved in cell wall biosynthesis